jgi:hypothetical protein
MSDEVRPTPAAPAEGGASVATAMFAVKEMRDELGDLKKQLKSLWITVIVVGVVVLVLAVFTLLPRLFGVSVLGGAGFRGGNFNRGTTSGQQFPGGAGSGTTGSGTTGTGQ